MLGLQKKNLVKEALADTLREMLEERSIDKITVEEIVERSGYSKRTFYNHFRDKHDVVSYIWKREYRSCMYEGDELLSTYDFLLKYHRHEASLTTFFRNVLTYSGQNNLWETVHEASIECTLLQMRRNGFEGELDESYRSAINFWVHGMNGMSRDLFENTEIKHRAVRPLTPEERVQREIALIPDLLRPWLLPDEDASNADDSESCD